MLEVARTLGRTSAGTFWSVALPLARPALAAGVALALMETLNDLGAVQYLGVSTLTVSIYATWLQRSSLAGAAQIAWIMLLFVLALLATERRCGRKAASTTRPAAIAPFFPTSRLAGQRGCAAVCLRASGADRLRAPASCSCTTLRPHRPALAPASGAALHSVGVGRLAAVAFALVLGLRAAAAHRSSCAPWCAPASATPCRARCSRSG